MPEVRTTIGYVTTVEAHPGFSPEAAPVQEHRFLGIALPLWFYLTLAAVQLGLQLRHCLAGVDYVVAALFIDDAYYFLQPAWNLRHVGFVTFDGINPTNGVQLLWFVVVYGLTWLASTKTVLLLLSGTTCAVLNAAVHPIIARFGATVQRRFLAAALSLLWFAVVLSDPLYLRGMDNTLHALICWLMVWQLAVFFRHLQDSPDASLVPLTAVLIANVWTRLDSALVSATVFLCCVGAKVASMRGSDLTTSRRIRSVLLPSVLAAAAGIVQLGAFWWMAGSLLPVSALVKARPGGLGVSWTGAFDELVARSFIHLELPPLHLPDAIVQLVVFATALVLLVGWFVLRRARGSWIANLVTAVLVPSAALLLVLMLEGALTPTGYLSLFALAALVDLVGIAPEDPGASVTRRVWYTVAAAFLAYHAVIVPLGMKPGYYSPWYQAPAHVFWILGIGVLADTVVRLQPRVPHRRAVAVTVAGVLVVAAVLAAGSAVEEYERSPLFAATLRAARHIAESAPADAVFASWNAGIVGYFSERTLINLDGLVNTPSYARALRSEDFRVLDYMARSEVEYVVDWSIPDEVRPALEPLFTFVPRPGWKPVVIYRLITPSTAQ